MKPEILQTDLEQTLLPWLAVSNKRFANLIAAKFREEGIELSREQMILLKHLYHEDGQVQNELACITNRDKTSLTRLVNNLEKKDLLKRVQCEDDQRCNKLFITKAGIAQFKKAFPIVKSLAHKIQEDISEEDLNTTIAVLKKVAQNIIDIEDEKK